MALKIRKEDQVMVMAGKEKGKTGKVSRVVPEKAVVFIEKLNMVKRHQKQRKEREPAGIIAKEEAIHVSNVKLICKSCQKPTRITSRVRTDGVKVRICKQCHQDID